MNTINRLLLLATVTAITFFAASCEKKDIKGEVVNVDHVSIAINSTDGRIVVPTDSNYTKTPEMLTIPVKVNFSDATPKRFNVNIVANNDTVNSLIADSTLTNTVLLDPAMYTFPASLDVGFGLDYTMFNIQVNITALERNYGKKLALALTLSNPTKSNTLDKVKKEVLVVINTSEALAPDEIHYVYLKAAGDVLNIPKEGVRYLQNDTYVAIPVTISLGGIATKAGFNVRIDAQPDTAQALIDNGTLTNTFLLNEGSDYLFPDSIDYAPLKNEASFDLSVRLDVLRDHYTELGTLGLTISNPTNYLLDTTRNTVVLSLDPQGLVEFDITDQQIGYAASRENHRTSEIAAYLVDNQINTKFLLFDFQGVTATLEFDSAVVTGAYSMTSANDAPGRDPQKWQLLGSQNGTSWQVLDEQEGESFSARFQTKKYYFDNSVAYKYYRLNVLETADGVGGLYQQAEWRMIRTP